jgi:anti-anti-sigma factor
MRELSVAVADGDPAVVTVTGEVDLLTAPLLAAPLRALIQERRALIQERRALIEERRALIEERRALIEERRVPGIDVDLDGVPFIDSTGIQVLVAASDDAHAADIPFRIRAASGQVKRVLGLTGVLETLGLS